MKRILQPIVILAAGITIGLIGASLISHWNADFGRLDIISFTETILGTVVAGIAITGAITIAHTWNDIDDRTKRIFDKHQAEMKQKIDDFTQEAIQSFDGIVKKASHMLEVRERVIKWIAGIAGTLAVMMVIRALYLLIRNLMHKIATK